MVITYAGNIKSYEFYPAIMRSHARRMAELAQKLNITKEETVFFERRLNAMARDGQILINGRGAVCVANKLALVKCRVEVHKDDFGFAVPLLMVCFI